VHGKGNAIVVYQDETKSMNNVLYVPSVNKKPFVSKSSSRHGMHYSFWKGQMLDLVSKYFKQFFDI
jgi:hypothetical protein